MTASAPIPIASREQAVPGREVIYRHAVAVRVTHWVNVLCLTLLLMSGLRIFNAHPALYWGKDGYRGMPAFLRIFGREDEETDEQVGYATIMGQTIVTTGVLGVSHDTEGRPVQQAFPDWLTFPGWAALALARAWHFAVAWLFVANGAVYLLFGIFAGHFRRDLVPTADQLRPRNVGAEIWNRVRLRRPRGEAARRYNVLQKLSYLAVVFGLLPAMLLTGLTMSPAVTTVAPLLFDLFGGRQSARTLHFIFASLLVLFVLVHIVQVLAAGPINGMRAMITGRYAIRPEPGA